MRPCKRPLAVASMLAVALAIAPASVLADPVGYAVGSGGPGFGGSSSLYRIDLATGAAAHVGEIGYVDVEGAALSPDGVLYAVADGGTAGCEGQCGPTDVLLRIDTATGAGTLVGPLGLAGQTLDYGLAFTCNGRLWMSSDTAGELWEVDPATGATQVRASLGAPVSGLAAWGNQLVGIAVADDHALYRIDTEAGSALRVGALSLPMAFYDAGLDYSDDGRLWATIDYWNPPGDLPEVERNDIALIDPQTGAGTIVAAVVGSGFDAATVQMEGLAVAAGPGCTVRQPTAVPATQPFALLAAIGLLLGLGGLRLRRG